MCFIRFSISFKFYYKTFFTILCSYHPNFYFLNQHQQHLILLAKSQGGTLYISMSVFLHQILG